MRDYPRTARVPTDAQAEMRVRFGELAEKAKGEKGLRLVDGRLLPPAAAKVAEMKGSSSMVKVVRMPLWEERRLKLNILSKLLSEKVVAKA